MSHDTKEVERYHGERGKDSEAGGRGRGIARWEGFKGTVHLVTSMAGKMRCTVCMYNMAVYLIETWHPFQERLHL